LGIVKVACVRRRIGGGHSGPRRWHAAVPLELLVVEAHVVAAPGHHTTGVHHAVSHVVHHATHHVVRHATAAHTTSHVLLLLLHHLLLVEHLLVGGKLIGVAHVC